MITRFAAAAIAAAGLLLNTFQPAYGASAQDFRVLHHERLLHLALDRRDDAGAAARSRATRLRFDALGRAFDAELEPNARLLANLDPRAHPTLAHLELYRGSLAAQAGTWVRVGLLDGELHALIWDGAELYGIEPARRLRGHLEDGDEPDRELVIFRLSDVQGTLNDEVIAPAGASPYAAFVSDLHAASATTAPQERLDLALVADTEFANSHPDVDAELLLRANYVDGIYSEQLGLQINVIDTQSSNREPDAFSSTDPTTLLESFRDYRSSSASLRSSALAHLFTGRELDGDVVGIAYMNAVCDESGVGLTEASDSVFHDSLITAHEIGHNLGAPHDAEAGSPCESTPPDYLMAPRLSGSDQLSQCSVSQIESMLARARCLGTAYAGDVRVALASAPSTLLGDELGVHISVDSLSQEANANVVVEFRATLADIASATSGAGHECTIVDGEVRCALGTFAAGAHDDIDVVLSGRSAGVADLQATALASNDTNPANNVAVSALEIEPAVILEVDVEPGTVTLGSGDAAPITITLANASTLTATDVTVELSSPFELTDLDGAAGACVAVSADSPRYRCSIGMLRSLDSIELHGVVHAPQVVAAGSPASGLLAATATAAEPLARAGVNSASAVIQAYDALADLEARVDAASSAVTTGERAQVTLLLRNLGPDAASAATLDIEFPAQVVVKDAADDRAACSTSGTHAVRCRLEALANGEMLEVSVGIAADQPGTYSWNASATHAGFDPDATNDAVTRTLEVSAGSGISHPASSGGSSGGGGGACWFLLAIAGFGLTRNALSSARARRDAFATSAVIAARSASQSA
jgi:hypothetical protein